MDAGEEQGSTSAYGVAVAIASRPELVSEPLNLRVTVPRCTRAFIYENIYPLLLFEGGGQPDMLLKTVDCKFNNFKPQSSHHPSLLKVNW